MKKKITIIYFFLFIILFILFMFIYFNHNLINSNFSYDTNINNENPDKGGFKSRIAGFLDRSKGLFMRNEFQQHTEEGNKYNEEGKKVVIGEKKLVLYAKTAAIGKKAKLQITDAGYEDYKDAAFYQVLDNDKVISPVAEINTVTLIVTGKEIGEDVTVRLLNLKKEELRKVNLKLEAMKE